MYEIVINCWSEQITIVGNRGDEMLMQSLIYNVMYVAGYENQAL